MIRLNWSAIPVLCDRLIYVGSWGSITMLPSSFTVTRRVNYQLVKRILSDNAPSMSPAAARPATRADIRGGEMAPLDFRDTRNAFKWKSTSDLWKSFIVFKLFQYEFLVNRSEQILNGLKTLLGKTLFSKLMKSTIFDQFIVGEDVEAMKTVLAKLKPFGIRPILAYSAEDNHHHHQMTSNLDDNSREKSLDKNLQSCVDCIHTVANICEMDIPFSATKITGLARPTLLLKMSELLVTSQRIFKRIADRPCMVTGQITSDSLHRGIEEMNVGFTDAHFDKLWKNLNRQRMNFFEWNDAFMYDNEIMIDFLNSLQVELMSDIEKDQMKSVMRRMETLSDAAQSRGVRLMVDAEQTYYQPAIRHITVHRLMPKYNLQSPVIYNTQQCYLKDALNEVIEDIAASDHYGCQFAVKTVRGAYVHEEISLAHNNGLESPTWTVKSDTDMMYHKVLENVMEKMKDGRVHVKVATHNEDTIKFAIEKMSSLAISPSSGCVTFGQQYGMSDHLSFTLGLNGYMVYKYMLYGTLDETIPYLIRRANENKGMLTGAVRERGIFATEIKRRLSLNNYNTLYK